MFEVVGNLQSDTYSYKIYINTALKRKAGTLSNVYFVLTGTKGSTGIRQLTGEKHGVRLFFAIYC